MYVEVDVEEGPNCWPLHRMFQAMSPPREISEVTAPDPRGDDVSCRVTGWSDAGPCAAYAVLVADSGEGAVTLVYGGDRGIRLQPAAGAAPWDLGDPGQWGEPCLLLDSKAEAR